MGEGKQIARAARKQAIRRKAQRRHSRFYERCAHWSFSHHDGEPICWHRERWVLAGTALLITALSGFILPAWASAMRPEATAPAHDLLPLALPKAPAATMQAPTVEDWRVVQVQPGQTLSDIFQGQGLSLADLQRVMDAAGGAASALHNIRPHQEFDFLLGNDGGLRGFRFDKDQASRATVRFDGAKPTLVVQAREMERREHVAHGTIDSSLFAAGAKAGMSAAMVGKLADLFKYDIDFVQDLREGDSFTVVYDDVYRDGSYLAEGDIIAAEFVNQGRRYTAYRFRKADGSYGWFSEDGRPIQKSFLRIPVDFTRISSTFSVARLHPILGRMRAHKGVDYAAPTGTPIHAAGDGVIKFKGWMNGYGNFVVIQHNGTISTAYGHMSRFASERVGQHVSQGQVIGYVGMTGLATGPHLHYEFRVNGVQRDPQTVTLPKPEPLPAAQLARFKAEVVQPQLARLKALDANIKLARLGSTARNDD
ncbi:OapA family protein [Fulvimonas soli]|jgi:murein DD-endopeptidase MepM/ murein hydrolase activator NlpD|uniref:Murein DD-endopeptidase MepM/ murein hydrolase activator NlpD n=1 Tax=Fulvimonas soli TaxID=155197 RepID=A0A316IGH5_9GAMM|nr:peptidoglycan DD-metalloendopeptidase family protein [Fulvimonas soli]PWK92627.1 murein DD-endopeptidase MepM/ murein hydrolase activator NlpD [Fulvimonas soli]TNY25459.1 peptidase M23 [Fulvimonas soli]